MTDGGALLRVRLTPRGGKNRIERIADGVIHARVAAAPVDGAANCALTELLANSLNVPKSRVRIVSGETARIKLVQVNGIDEAEAASRLSAQSAAQ